MGKLYCMLSTALNYRVQCSLCGILLNYTLKVHEDYDPSAQMSLKEEKERMCLS